MNPARETRPPDIDVDVDVQIHWCAACTPDAATGRHRLELSGVLACQLCLAVVAGGGVERQKPAGAGYEVFDIVE